MTYEKYIEIIKDLNDAYGTAVDVEHEFIHEFYENQIPLFKLILGDPGDGQDALLIISFHLDLPATSAIQWFLRITSLHKDANLSAPYIRDSNGDSYVGEDAEIVRMYALEQEILSTWIKSERTEEEATARIEKEVESPEEPPKTFATVKAAVAAFKRLGKKKNDTLH